MDNQRVLPLVPSVLKKMVLCQFLQNVAQVSRYGKALLVNLSKDLSLRYGRGVSRSNLQYMRLLYQYYPICQTLSGKLSWSHYVELVSIDDNLAREFT